jgi:uncharacterized protein YcbK (DUF882 family)
MIRRLLLAALLPIGLCAFAGDPPWLAGASPTPQARQAVDLLTDARSLALVHTHTHEQLKVICATDDNYLAQALEALNLFLRDHYTGDVGRIDPRLFDLLHRIREVVGSVAAYEVISGYRCAATDARLRRTGSGGVATHSLHMQGCALDVQLPGVGLADLRDAALSLRAGGVGYYPREQFVQIDTGRVRSW